MRFIHLIKKKIFLALAVLFTATGAMAQDAAATAEKTVTSSYNMLAILLVVMTAVLAFVIWGLGQVLVTLSRQAMEKERKASKISAAAMIVFLVLLSNATFAQDVTAKVLPNYGGLSATTFYMFVAVIVTEVFAVLFLTFSIRRINREIMPQSEMGVATKTPLRAWWDKIDQKLFTKAVPIEKEADVLLDHDYDGIKELDNALPPWWKYGFYITILVAVFYLFNYHGFGNGKNPTQEYAAEMEKAKLEKEAFEATNKDKIDEKNVPMANAAGIKWASDTYTANCAACHGPKGGGGAGPNLTDDYWIHKGSLNDIYASIKTGYPDKGMQSWAVKFSPKEMSQLASFVKSIHGTNPPGGLPPKGDLFVETATTPAGDSAKAAIVDTLKKVVKVDTATKKK